MVEILGIVGSLLFAFSALPESYATYRRGKSLISNGMLSMWATGLSMTFLYVVLTIQDPILLTKYVINMLCLMVIIYYKVFPRSAD